jgi:hypothetical protein
MRQRTPVLSKPLPKRGRGWKRGPKGLYGLRVHSPASGQRAYSLGLPRRVGDAMVELGLTDQQFVVEVVPEGILYRRVD